MEIKFLGTGGAFDVECLNSSVIVSDDGVNTLIDCGFTVFPQLVKKKVAEKVNQLLITHLHDDHVGSLSGYILYRKHRLGLKPLPLLYPSEEFADQIRSFLSFSLGNPDNYIRFEPLKDHPHIGAIDTFGKHVPNMQTWSYFFRNGQESIVFSGDLGDANILFEQIKKTGLPNPRIFHELTFSKDNPAHTFYKDLEPWLSDYPIKGYHCCHESAPKDNRIPLVGNDKNLMC